MSFLIVGGDESTMSYVEVQGMQSLRAAAAADRREGIKS